MYGEGLVLALFTPNPLRLGKCPQVVALSLPLWITSIIQLLMSQLVNLEQMFEYLFLFLEVCSYRGIEPVIFG